MGAQCLLKLIIISMLFLTGCGANNGEPKVQSELTRGWLKMPALTIIQEAILELSSTDKDVRNPDFANKACAMARGEIRADLIRNVLTKEEPTSRGALALTPSQRAILTDPDPLAQTSACAAFIATSVLLPVDVNEFMVVKDKQEGPESGRRLLQIDPKRLESTLPTKYAIATVNSEIFALIATELQRRPGLSFQQYRDMTKMLFSKLSQLYLNRLDRYRPNPAIKYELIRFDNEHFSFSTSSGVVFDYSRDGLVLKQRGVVIYGQGLLVGERYPIHVRYFTNVDPLLRP